MELVGQVHNITRILKTREALLEWFPKATNQVLPAMITVSTCRACGRLDKHITTSESRPDCTLKKGGDPVPQPEQPGKCYHGFGDWRMDRGGSEIRISVV